MVKGNDQGFTLLEVLIAGVILFITVAAATSVFSSAVKSKLAASSTIKSSVYAKYIASNISFLMQQGERSGSSNFDGVNYSWRAQQSDRKPIRQIPQEGSSSQSVNGNAILWRVELQLEEQHRAQNFSFAVTTWE